MQWPARDTCAAGDSLLDCRVIAPSDIKKYLFKRATLQRLKEKQIGEMENGC